MAGTTRQIVFGIAPDGEITNTFSWSLVSDLNTTGAAISCAYVPKSKTSAISFLQERMFMGTVNANIGLETFRNDLGQDDGTTLRGEAITANLDPTKLANVLEGESDAQASPQLKRFTRMSFPYVNSLDKGLDITFAIDTIDPHISSTIWRTLTWTAGNIFAGLPSAIAKWINLRVIDDRNIVNDDVFSAFNLHYYGLSYRERKK